MFIYWLSLLVWGNRSGQQLLQRLQILRLLPIPELCADLAQGGQAQASATTPWSRSLGEVTDQCRTQVPLYTGEFQLIPRLPGGPCLSPPPGHLPFPTASGPQLQMQSPQPLSIVSTDCVAPTTAGQTL